MEEIFYDCATAPSPRRVRMFLAEKGLAPTVREVDLASGEHMGDEFRARNAFSTVPVLELADGRAISEIHAICLYLEETYPEPALLGSSPADRALTLMWSQRIEMYLMGAIAESFRNFSKAFVGRALPGPFAIPQVPDLVERGRQRTLDVLGYLNHELTGRPFIAGEAFTMADITAFVGVEFAARIKIGIPEDAGALIDWHQRVAGRPSAS